MKPHEKPEVILTFQNYPELLAGVQPPLVAYPSTVVNVLPSSLLVRLAGSFLSALYSVGVSQLSIEGEEQMLKMVN